MTAATSEKAGISANASAIGPRRVLLVEHDEDVIARVLASLESSFDEHIAPVVARSLAELHEASVHDFHVVICAASLPDGTGIDALAYVRGMAPAATVILSGSPADAPIATEAIRAGALDFLLTCEAAITTLPLSLQKAIAHHRIRQENERLQRELSNSFCELAEKNNQLRQMIDKLEAMARTDDLTGLCNRRWLTSVLERAWSEATRFDRPLAFLMIDLDCFKTLNDTMGHQCGDEMLRLASRVIEANCRQVDVAARYGGDEFCILMPQTQAHEAVRVAERILREFAHCARQLPADAPEIGMSIGVAHIDLSNPINAEELILHADEAMYVAKMSGKGCVRLRGPSGSVPA